MGRLLILKVGEHMSIIDNIKLALSSLTANKMRTLLTMLGIIIGIGSVIGIVTVGDSLSGSLTDSLSSFGGNTITVSLSEKSSDNGYENMFLFGPSQPKEEDLITDTMIDELKLAFGEQIQNVGIYENLNSTSATYEGNSANIMITGVNSDMQAIDDINIIVQLKRAWQYIINEDRPVSLRVMKNINSVVAKMDSLAPGELRNGSGFVATLRGDSVSLDVDEQVEEKYLQELLENKDKSATEKSIELMYHLMRNQIFWDGNKRTATLIANKYMIDNGVGLINIPLDYWDEWNKLISDYYYDNDMSKIKEWTYKVGIQGIDSYRNISQDRENFVNLTKRKSKER